MEVPYQGNGRYKVIFKGSAVVGKRYYKGMLKGSAVTGKLTLDRDL